MRLLLCLLLLCCCAASDASPPKPDTAQQPTASLPLKHPPLAKFAENVLWTRFVDRYQSPGRERYLDTTVFVLPDGLDPKELPSKLARTTLQYLQSDQIEKLAASTPIDQAFSYFRLV